MEHEHVVRTGTDTTGKQLTRRLRVVPPAITPLSGADLVAGGVSQLRDEGLSEFRETVRRFLGGESAGTYTSFRRALAACLRALSAASPDSDTVLVPAFCSSDYEDAIEGAGLEMERYDVDPTTLSADLDALPAFDEDVLAVVAVNVLGYSSPMEKLADRCGEEVFLVEALGYGLGASYRGDRLGTFGDCSVLNFQQGKPIPIGGGMVVSQTPTLQFSDDDREPVPANAATLGGYTLFAHPTMYGLYRRIGQPLVTALGESERVSTHPESKMGVEYSPPFRTLSDFQGAVGCRVFERLPEHRRAREETARFYAQAFERLDSVSGLDPVDGLEDHQHVRYPLLFDAEDERERAKERLTAAGIQATTLYDWPPIDPDRYPGAAAIQRRVLTLPTHPYVSDTDRKRTVELVLSAIA